VECGARAVKLVKHLWTRTQASKAAWQRLQAWPAVEQCMPCSGHILKMCFC
jgi:hypothetical protein